MPVSWPRPRAAALAWLAALILGWPAAASAQDGLVFLDVNAGARATSRTFVDNAVFTELFEEGDLDATYSVPNGPTIDVTGGVWLGRGLAVGVGYARFERQDEATLSARIPHPLFFGRNRPVSGSAGLIRRTEHAIHLQLRWYAAGSGRLSLALFGGPTIYRIQQPVVTGVVYTDAYPFETATFLSAETQPVSATAFGLHAGVDVSVFVTRTVGFGVTATLGRGTAEADLGDAGITTLEAGGFEAGGGLRLRF